MDAQVLNFKAYSSGALAGFFDLEMGGLTYLGCKCFRKGDSVWFQFPAQKSTDAAGEVKYTPIVTATTATMREVQDAIRDQLRAALESGAGAQPGQRIKVAGTYFKRPAAENLSDYRTAPGDDGIPF